MLAAEHLSAGSSLDGPNYYARGSHKMQSPLVDKLEARWSGCQSKHGGRNCHAPVCSAEPSLVGCDGSGARRPDGMAWDYVERHVTYDVYTDALIQSLSWIKLHPATFNTAASL